MYVTLFKNFKFSYTTNTRIEMTLADVVIGYDGELTYSEFIDRVNNILSGELHDLLFTPEDYEHLDKLAELDELGLISVATVEDLDQDFEYIAESIESEFLDGLSESDTVQVSIEINY